MFAVCVDHNVHQLYVGVILSGTRGDLEEASHAELSKVADSLTSHQYKSYMVMMVHRLRANTEVQLGRHTVCVYVCVDIVGWACVCAQICVCVDLIVCMCVHRFVCVWTSLCACVCIDLCVCCGHDCRCTYHACMCEHMYVCVCLCWCVGHCVCIGVGVWRFVCVFSICSSTCVTVYHVTSNIS